MLLSQVRLPDGRLQVVVRDGMEAAVVRGAASTYDLAMEAIVAGQSLAEAIAAHGLDEAVDLAGLLEQGRVTLPITHPDPAHLHITGTGLTHLGSASARDAMHAKLSGADTLTDSMRMFRMGLEGGRPEAGKIGEQPEWFYKGNGHVAVAPGHVTERVNYLWLAHSKLRPASFGPEILVGTPPADIRGTSRICRGGAVIWEKPFLSGEANMSHTFANLEHHHFKYGLFRQPGEVHVHMFGTATLSFADGIVPQDGDMFEIEAAPFGLPLKNPLRRLPATGAVSQVQPL